MKPSEKMLSFCTTLLLFYCLPVSTLTITMERKAVDGDIRTLGSGRNSAASDKTSATLFLLTGYKPPGASRSVVAPKAVEMEDGDDPPAVAELPSKPLPQTMLTRNMTEDGLRPPYSPAQVAPPPRQLVNVDVCRYTYIVCLFFGPNILLISKMPHR